MIPERTNYLTNGVDGVKRLAQGPELSSYRGLQIIPTRKFSMDAGTAPRDLLKRRVRVAEYYRIPWNTDNKNRTYEFYDQSRDTMFRLSYEQLTKMADPKNGGPGSSGTSGYKRSFSMIHDDKNWNPNAIANEVYIKSNTISGGLHLPETTPNNHRRLKARYTSEDTTGANLSSQETNMSVKDALNSISTQDYHIASEMFGGGLFNDTITQGSGVETNFNAIKNPARSIGHTFVPWLMANIMTNIGESGNPVLGRINEYESNIKSGYGSPTRECIIKMLWHRACRIESDLKPYSTPLESIVHISRPEILKQLDIGNNFNKFESFVNSAETVKHLHDFTGSTEYNSKMLKEMLQEFKEPATTLIMSTATQNLKTEFMDKFKRNAKVSEKIAIEPAIEATVQYFQFIEAWSSDIYLEKSIEGFIKNTTVTHLGGQGTGRQAYHKFDTLKPMIKADYICREFHGAIRYLGGYFDGKSANAQSFENIVEKFNNTDDMAQFKVDMQNHTEEAIIASNVANAGKFQEVFRPNLHITRSSALSSADAESSLSSMNENTWLLQHLASTMPLTNKMCRVLTAMASTSDEHLMGKYKQFLTGDANNADNDPYNTLLMHWYMSRIHPDNNVREQAKEICGFNHEIESNLVQCISHLLDSNATFDNNVENAFENMRTGRFYNGNGFYCPGVAAETYVNMPSYVKRQDANNSFIDQPVNWTNMPVVDFESFNADKYAHSYYNPVFGRNESTVDAVRVGEKMPWVDRLSGNTVVHNRNVIGSTMSALKCHWFLMDFERSATDQRNPICGPDLAHLCANSARYCASNTEIAINTLLPILANRFWKPTSRAMLNGAGVPMAKPTNDNGIISVSLQQTNSPSPTLNLKQHWVVQGTGYHLMHGPSLPLVGEFDADFSSETNKDIVILRPNIEHEMLGVIMGRGGTQELGATFWYVCDKIGVCVVTCLFGPIY